MATAGHVAPGPGWRFGNSTMRFPPNSTASAGFAVSNLIGTSAILDAHAILTTILAVTAVIISTTWFSFLRRRRSLPPGPSPWPLLGNLPDLGALPFRSLAKLADRYGPILTVWFGATPSVIISSPDMAREVLKTKDKLCASRPLPRGVAVLTLGGKDVAFSPPNNHWRAMRRLGMLHLLSARNVEESLPIREREIREMLDAISTDAAAAAAAGGETETAANGAPTRTKIAPSAVTKIAKEGLELRRYLTRATLNNILRLTVGKHFSYSSIRGANAASTNELLDAAMKTDWEARIAAIRGGKPGVASPTRAAAGAAAELEEGEKVFAIIEETFAVSGAFNLADYVPLLSSFDPQRIYSRTLQLKPQIHGFVRACIEERRQLRAAKAAKITVETETTEKTGKDDKSKDQDDCLFVDKLLAMEGEGEHEVDGDEILMLQIDMMMAGTDTTSKTVEWALAELAQHPDMLARLQAEVDTAYTTSARAASAAKPGIQSESRAGIFLPVQDMEYLQAVVKETLRHHPVAPFLIPHLTTEDVTLGGYHIPPNTMIQVNAWALAHDPGVWINPHEFEPTRFLGPGAAEVTGQNFSVLPFGTGRRGCLGTNLGLDLAARMLANFVLRFDFELTEDVRAAGGMDMGESFGLTMALAKPLRLVLRERRAG